MYAEEQKRSPSSTYATECTQLLSCGGYFLPLIEKRWHHSFILASLFLYFSQSVPSNQNIRCTFNLNHVYLNINKSHKNVIEQTNPVGPSLRWRTYFSEPKISVARARRALKLRLKFEVLSWNILRILLEEKSQALAKQLLGDLTAEFTLATC